MTSSVCYMCVSVCMCVCWFICVHTQTHELYMYRIFYSIKLDTDEHFLYVGPDRSVGKATVYWMDGSGFETRWGKIFSVL